MRRNRESSAKGHGTPPLVVQEVDPFDEHPTLGPMMEKRRRMSAKKVQAKHKTKVKVDVEVKSGTPES